MSTATSMGRENPLCGRVCTYEERILLGWVEESPRTEGKAQVRTEHGNKEAKREESSRRDLPTASLDDAEASGRISIPKSPILLDIKRSWLTWTGRFQQHGVTGPGPARGRERNDLGARGKMHGGGGFETIGNPNLIPLGIVKGKEAMIFRVLTP